MPLVIFVGLQVHEKVCAFTDIFVCCVFLRHKVKWDSVEKKIAFFFVICLFLFYHT